MNKQLDLEYTWGKDPIVKIDDLKHLDAYFDILADEGKALRFKEPKASKDIIKYAYKGKLKLFEYLKYVDETFKEFSVESKDINNHISELKKSGVLKENDKQI